MKKRGFTQLNSAMLTAKRRYLTGFTLIELLVVIAIIAILATIVIINVTAARTKANDTKVFSEITEANKGAMACYANGNLPVAPMPITAIFPPSANRKKIDSASVSVCTDPPSGLGSYWPWLNQGTAAYITWRYGGNSAINQTTGKWTWSAAFVAPGKGIIFTEKDSSKVGF